MRDRTNIRDALENHEENKNKDLSSTICEFVSLECTPQVQFGTVKLLVNWLGKWLQTFIFSFLLGNNWS